MARRRNHGPQYLDYMLAVASERVRRDLASARERRGVPLEHWRILDLLRDGGGRSMGELAEAALLSLPTATRVIDRMVSDALVYRAPDPGDRRRVLVLISDKGRALWREIKRDTDRYHRDIAAQYGDAWMQELIAKLDELTVRPEAVPRRRRRTRPDPSG